MTNHHDVKAGLTLIVGGKPETPPPDPPLGSVMEGLLTIRRPVRGWVSDPVRVVEQADGSYLVRPVTDGPHA